VSTSTDTVADTLCPAVFLEVASSVNFSFLNSRLGAAYTGVCGSIDAMRVIAMSPALAESPFAES